MSLYRRLRYQVRRVRMLRGSPHSLALGCAVGMFMGIMPVLPLRSLLIFLFAAPFRANLVAALVVGTTVANPFVLVFWYWLSLACGNLLVPDAVTWDTVSAALGTIRQASGFAESMASVANIGWDIAVVLLAGGFLIALPAGIVTYLVAIRYFTKRQDEATATAGQ